MANITVALDAGHGGSDSGAVYGNRREKDDTLRLTRAVGDILEDNGVDVFYVRTDDEYETPFKKATDANNAGADYFVSIHRNSSEIPNQYNGAETLIYGDGGIRSQMAANINSELENAGFRNLGTTNRPNLVVLKRTQMPAVLVEAGFINSDTDNAIFDNNFNQIANGIANGILKTIQSNNGNVNYNETNRTPETTCPVNPQLPENEETAESLYRVQVGAYHDKNNADRMLDSLLIEGFPAFIIYEDNLYKVQVGAFRYLSNAIKMEQRLRRFRYNTYIVYS